MTIFLDSDKGEKTIPLVAIREGVIFPHTEVVLTFGRPKSLAAIEAASRSGRLICLFTQKNPNLNDPKKNELYSVGTLATVERVLRTNGELHALVRGIARIRLESIESEEPYLVGKVSEVSEIIEDSDEIRVLCKHLTASFKKAVDRGKQVDFMIFMKLMGGLDAAELADQIAYTLDIKTAEKQEILEMAEVRKRLVKIATYLSQEIKILELERSITSKTQRRFDKSVREAMLRERKKTIEKELGEEEEEDEIKELKAKIKKAKMPKEAEEKALKELKRLAKMTPQHPEVGYIRTYLDWLIEMPWSVSTPNKTTIAKAAKILDEDHYGLSKIKERVVEYLAVMKLKEESQSKQAAKNQSASGGRGELGGPTILCFIGPPGVGKTSIGKSIARSLGRKFVRMSLGGIRDEAEIRGHRRTYVGAMPGRIIQGIKNAGSNNPVFMLDEIDKVGADFRGDPSAALLEALDPEQNYEFSDHYLEVPFDLSKVMFITTGNILDTIPPALRDRMETIRFPGYTEDEKFNIAKRFLWAKQLRFNGLGLKTVKLADPALYHVIRRYTREAGVRELERNLATICRKLARKIADHKPGRQGQGKLEKTIVKSDIHKFLGPARFTETLAEKKDEIGMATALAYTQAGGDILFIEVALMPGRGKLLLTGKLGEVMKESGKAALSYVRSRWQELGLRKGFYKNLDIHIHVPEGAVPKDGPSAGAAIALALVSALTKRPVDRTVGMTGEITLRGRVLEIGGVKEKIIAAHRAGLATVILPKDNKKDLEDVPAKIKKDMKLVFASHMDEVLNYALKKK
jgi:ATP-dependent Lon protease